ncbi:substrate-binding domain-containing protein [Mycobacterium sp. NPDC006124]|uniref:substrate-binding domain-containing protein n=1 Tax=Mycobacterium sp. NPDC006124 TaxID=3156729 RepID=UPI0033AAB11C
MGRHSIPDPEDSSEVGPDAGDDQPRAPHADQYPKYDGYDDGYDDDADYAEYDDGYDESEHEQPGYGEATSSRDEDGGYPRLEDREAATTALPTAPGAPNRRDWESSEWTGSHRAITPKRRGISVGVIVALVTVVVVVGAVIAWRFFGDALSQRSQAGAARCVAGEVSVAVMVDPSIADQITPLAEKYNQSAAPVGDKCVKVGVKAADSDQVVTGFSGPWPGDLGEQPALWIPGSSISEARLEAAAGEKTVSDSRSLVTSPVMLAMRPQLKSALGQRNWGALPGLQSNPTALDGMNLPGWGSLKLALPLTGDSDATYLAAEAVASASAPQGQPPTAGSSAIATLRAAQPKLADDKTSTAMDAMLGAADPATADVHAVVATEQQIFQRGSQSDAKDKLAAWLPSGPAAVADYPTVLLAGTWLSQEQVSAASEFARFLRKPEALTDLAAAGFRAEGTTPPQSDVTDFGTLPAALSVGDPGMRATLANLVSAPAQNPAVTVLLDQSMTADEGGKSRLANVTAALTARLQALPPTSAVGLWTFDGVSGRSEVPMGPLDEQVGGTPRSQVLTTNLNGQVASNGGAVSFTTLRLLYPEAVANFREGQPNSVLVITAGPHTDQSLDGAGLQDFIKQTFNQARPVAVNVVDFGADPDRSTWEAVAQTTGGDYQNLNGSAGPELTAALTSALG